MCPNLNTFPTISIACWVCMCVYISDDRGNFNKISRKTKYTQQTNAFRITKSMGNVAWYPYRGKVDIHLLAEYYCSYDDDDVLIYTQFVFVWLRMIKWNLIFRMASCVCVCGTDDGDNKFSGHFRYSSMSVDVWPNSNCMLCLVHPRAHNCTWTW